MEKSAVRHNADREFCFAEKKDTFVVRIYTKAGDCEQVSLCIQDKYLPIERMDTRKEIVMERVACDGLLDYYEARVNIHMLCMRYYFALTGRDGETLYYANYRFYKERPADIYQMFDCPQQVREEELFFVPKWAEGRVVYQIFVDRFASDKQVPEELWYKEKMEHGDRLHGNLKGITAKLPYLEELGVEVLYLTPIFKAGSSHKYDTIDYMEIDPDFGTKEDLGELVKKAHEKGMYVILDGVFNHTSTEFFAFRDLLENQENSPYRDWYYPESFPVCNKEMPNYKAFAYYGRMPKLNCANKEVREYIFKVVSYWIKEYGVDGFRLDVADEIGHDFWRTFRKKIREINSEALIVGEVWHFSPEFLRGDEWDSVMNYRFYQAVKSFFAKKEITAGEFAGELSMLRGRLHTALQPLLWNLIGSHDTPRFLHEAGENKRALYLAAAMQLFYPGMPMIYYGDEAGMTGGNDPDCRRGMLWEKEKRDEKLFLWYQRLIALRKAHPALARGSQKWVRTEDETGLLVFSLSLDGEELTVLLHNGEGEISLPEYAGRYDVLKEQKFDGKTGAYGVSVLTD